MYYTALKYVKCWSCFKHSLSAAVTSHRNVYQWTVGFCGTTPAKWQPSHPIVCAENTNTKCILQSIWGLEKQQTCLYWLHHRT